jgi:hypothetical protein
MLSQTVCYMQWTKCMHFFNTKTVHYLVLECPFYDNGNLWICSQYPSLVVRGTTLNSGVALESNALNMNTVEKKYIHRIPYSGQMLQERDQ